MVEKDDLSFYRSIRGSVGDGVEQAFRPAIKNGLNVGFSR
jgi:hypothetical protein